MKKILLLLVMVLGGTLGGWAITYPKTGVIYALKNVHGFYHSTNTFKHYMMANDAGTQLTGATSLTDSNLSACGWVFEKAPGEENAYYMKNVKTKKYIYLANVNNNSQSVPLSATEKSVLYLFDGNSANVDGEYFISFKNANVDNSTLSMGIHGTSGMQTWQGNGTGNQWVLEEVETVYTIEGGTSSEHRGYLAAGEDITAYPVLSEIAWTTHSGKSTTAINGGKYWYIQSIGNENAYVLYNLGIGKYLVNESDKVNFGDYPYAWKIVDNTSENAYKAITIYNGNTQISFACGTKASTTARNVNLHDEMSDGGSKHTLKLVLPSELTGFAAQITEVKSKVSALANAQVPLTFSLTDGALNTHSYTGGGELYPLISGVEDYVMGNPVWNGNTFNADITFPFEVSSVSELNPTLIGQGSWTGADKKWTVVDGNVKVVNGTPSLGASQWLIYPSLNGKVFTFKIKSVSADKYVTANPDSDNDAQASNTPVTLTENGTAFTYTGTGYGDDKGFAYVNNSPKTLFLTRNGSGDNNVHLGVYEASSSHQGSAVRFPTFNQYKISITQVGYSTLYSPFPVIVNDANNNGSNKLEYFAIMSEPTESSVILQNMTQNISFDYIPAKQGTILKGAPGTYIFTQIETQEDQDALWADNKLKGSVISTYEAGPAYVLSAPDGVESVGLYKAELNMNETGVKVGKETGTHFKNNAGKAYLPASDEASDARFLVFNFGDDMETGITETENENVNAENGEVYDLSGRRVQGAQKGIFIVNGKKVVR